MYFFFREQLWFPGLVPFINGWHQIFVLQQKISINFWSPAIWEPLTWLPPYPHARRSASSHPTTLVLLLTPGIQLSPSTQGYYLPHSLTKFLLPSPSGHPAPGPSLHMESLLGDAYRLDKASEIYRVAEPEKSKVIFNGSSC